MSYGNAPGRPGLGSTLGLLAVGMAACAAWAWSARPALVASLAGRLTGSDYVLLAVFLIVGLVVASMLASAAQAFLQVLIHLAQVALLVAVAAAGVILWRSYSDRTTSSNATPDAAVPARLANTIPAADPPTVDPEERRRELEAALLELDTRDDSSWWQHK